MLRTNKLLAVFIFLLMVAGCAGTDRLERTEVEIYRKDSAPGVSEYRREYRESNRYPATSADRDRMLQLCREFERDFRSGR